MSACSDLGTISNDEFTSRYEILSFLDQGSEGSIYQARNKTNHQIVALKMVPHGQVEEIYPSCRYPSIFEYTDGIVTVYEYGFLPDFDQSFFYTMPILQPQSSVPLQELDVMFELLWSIVILSLHGISHDDLHPYNILYRTVPHQRQYIVNDRVYLITSTITPVIIDFVASFDLPSDMIPVEMIWYLFRDNSTKWFFRPALITNMISNTHLISALLEFFSTSTSFNILLHPIFDSLRIDTVITADHVKTFKPLTI